MRVSFVLLIIILVVALVEYQLIGVKTESRKEKCSVVTTDTGVLRKATAYEYYDCLSK